MTTIYPQEEQIDHFVMAVKGCTNLRSLDVEPILNDNTLPTTIKHLHFQSAAHKVGHLSSDVDMRGRAREGQGVGVVTKSNLAFD